MNKLSYPIIIFLLIFTNISKIGFSQEKSDPNYTLDQAISYAKQNNMTVVNSRIDLEIAKKKIWETTAIGLPQVGSKLSFSYMLTIPDKIKEFSSLSSLGTWMYGVDQTLYQITQNPNFGNIPEPEQTDPVNENDLKWGLTYDITASQIIFSGAYLVGLQTAKTFRLLSEEAITKSEQDVTESVSNAYYLVLITEENKLLLDSVFKNTNELLGQIREMNKQGFVEETDVDQLMLTVSTIKNAQELISRQHEVAKYLLKFQMGFPIDSNIVLTDKLDMLLSASDLNALLANEFVVENHVDFKLLEMQEKLAKMNLKLQKSAFLPDVVAFYTHQENFNKNSFSFTPPNMIGVGVSIPIFGSGMKLAKTSQAKLGLNKMTNTKNQVSAGLLTSFNDAKSTMQTALAQYTINKENVVLSKKIYTKTLVKYKEGVSSSLEMTQAQNQYLQAQTTYYTSVIQLQTAKSKLEKLLNK